MSRDVDLGQELAELARQFLLWLHDNDLPGVPGLKRTPLSHFSLYAGIYRKLEPSPQRMQASRTYDNRVLPRLWPDHEEEQRRFHQLRLGVDHLLLVDNPSESEEVVLPDGRRSGPNRIVLTDSRPLDRPGALMTVNPRLDGMVANDATMAVVRNIDFAALKIAVDLVWDDAAAGKAARFKYPSILDSEPERSGYAVGINKVPVPAELDPGPTANNRSQILAQRVKAFREHLYHNATYRNRELVRDEGGAYYRKWLAKQPVNQRQRQFRPTLLHNDYMKECFSEFVMKRGDNLLLIEQPGVRHVYRLLWEPPARTAAAPTRFTVQPLLRIGSPLGAPVKLDSKGEAADDDGGDEAVKFPVTAVFFHALDGADHLPTQQRYGKIAYSGVLPDYFVFDYKRYLRWYFNNEKLDLGDDANWLERFAEIFFGDQIYPIELSVHPAGISRDEVFLDMMSRAAESEKSGPIKDRLAELTQWAKGHPWRYVFMQGTNFGTSDAPRELIGLAGGRVFEWRPGTGVVTMTISDFLRNLQHGGMFSDIARSTAGALPWINFITWGGVIVMTGGTVIVTGGTSGLAGTSLGVMARTSVTKLSQAAATHFGGKLIARKAAKEARPFLIAMMVNGIMGLVPKSDTLVYEFVYGLFEGFGGGAVEHYLSEIDERLERQIKKIPQYALNYATKGGYRAYVVYDKVRVAVTRVSGIVQALRTVLVDDRAKLITVELGKFSRHLGFAFLVILFVVIYLDWVYRSRPGIAVDKWVQQQTRALQWMVVKTGNDIANYARDVKNDLLSLGKDDPRDPEVTAVVRKHDQRLVTAVGNILEEGVMAVPAIAEYLQMLLGEMGIENWEELKGLGFTEILTRGLDALPARGLAKDQARKAGAAVGELIGTLMLERRVVPEASRKNSKLVFPMGPHDAVKGSLAGGTWRALWKFAIFPFKDLGSMPEALKRGLDDQMVRKNPRFTHKTQRDAGYREFVSSLIDDEEELTRRLVNLAKQVDLPDKLRTMVNSAVADKIPPSLTELTKNNNPEWPADAILFLLYSWLRLGLHQALEGFHLIEEGKAFGGTFRLAELFDILGLDIALDDKTVAGLKARFSGRATATP